MFPKGSTSRRHWESSRPQNLRAIGADNQYLARTAAGDSGYRANGLTQKKVVYVSARLKDVVSSAAQLHGWNQPAGVNVNIANIPLPTAEERAEMRALDAKLDAIAAKLKA